MMKHYQESANCDAQDIQEIQNQIYEKVEQSSILIGRIIEQMPHEKKVMI